MKRMLALLALSTAWGTSSAPAQTPTEPPAEFTLRPAAGPRPALKYRLVPERLTLVPGNAAVFYHRGVQMTIEKRNAIAAGERRTSGAHAAPAEDLLLRWISGPISRIPLDPARKLLESYASALKEAELGAARSTCDWEFDRRTDGIYLLIPEIQEMRSLARLVSLRARLAILDGKTDEAMHWIEVGLVMGRHVSQGPTVIQALVGISIDFVMIRCLEDLIQAPGTPSLFWALADRPRPFIDMRRAMEGERYALETELPELRDLDRGPWGIDQARKFADVLQRKLFTLASGEPIPGIPGAGPMDMPAAARRLGIAAMCAKVYPEARRALIAQGRTEAEVEAMPVIQASSLSSYQECQRLRDEAYKWMNLPYWQSFDKLDRLDGNTVGQKLANPLLTMFQLLMPALNSVRVAAVRVDRQLDALQCVEAIRLHAAAHGGKMPAGLDSITEAPVPADVATGKPFEYKLDGDSATLSAPVLPGGPDHPSFAIRYILKPAR